MNNFQICKTGHKEHIYIMLFLITIKTDNVSTEIVYLYDSIIWRYGHAKIEDFIEQTNCGI